MAERTTSLGKALVGLAIALGTQVGLVALSRLGGVSNAALEGTVLWLAWALVLYWAIKVEKLDLTALGFRKPDWSTLAWGTAGAITVLTVMGTYYGLMKSGADNGQAARIASQPFLFLLFFAVSGGVIEEMLMRFYAITRLHQLTGSKWIASIIPLAIFAGYHVPSFGWGQAIPVSLGAIVFTLLYWWRRDYLCNVLAHFLVDFSAFVLSGLAASHGA